MDILFSTKTLQWDGIQIPMQTVNLNLVDLDKINCNVDKHLDVFAIASSKIKILDAKYEKANLDAFLTYLLI